MKTWPPGVLITLTGKLWWLSNLESTMQLVTSYISKNTYVRMLFVDFPQQVIMKLRVLGDLIQSRWRAYPVQSH